MLQSVYAQAQQHIIQFYKEQYHLFPLLRLLHQFYLFGAGDFFLEFITRVEHGFLFTPAEISNGWFQEEFNTCVSRTSLASHAQFIADHVRLKPLTSLSRFDIWKTPFFSVEMEDNLRVIFTPAVMAKYEQIFSILMLLQTQSFDLERIWVEQGSLAKELERLRDKTVVGRLKAVLSSFGLLRLQMHSFLATLQSFYFLHVVEKYYNGMVAEMQKSERFDDLLRIHTTYVSELEKCFFTDGKQVGLKSTMLELLRMTSSIVAVQVDAAMMGDA